MTRTRLSDISLEQILQKDPTVLFVETFSYGPAPVRPVSEQLADNPVWGRLEAVRRRKVVEVSTEIWSNGHGPTSIGIVLDEAARAMYG